jgi:hypothetical protein
MFPGVKSFGRAYRNQAGMNEATIGRVGAIACPSCSAFIGAAVGNIWRAAVLNVG